MRVKEIYNAVMSGRLVPEQHYIMYNEDSIEDGDSLEAFDDTSPQKPMVECWSRDGSLIGTYDTLKDASKDTGVDISQISRSCKSEVKKYCKKGTIYFRRNY